MANNAITLWNYHQNFLFFRHLNPYSIKDASFDTFGAGIGLLFTPQLFFRFLG